MENKGASPIAEMSPLIIATKERTAVKYTLSVIYSSLVGIRGGDAVSVIASILVTWDCFCLPYNVNPEG